MRWYVLVFLEKGAKWTPEVTAESKKLQEGHMANINRLGKEKKLLLAGPVADGGDLRGIFVFDTESLEEAKSWCDADPAVQAERLRCRMVRWFSVKGVGVHEEKAR